MTGALKNDKDKPRPELIPPEMIEALSEILAFGAKKYGENNWQKGFKWSRVFGACMRHLWTWWDPRKPDVDPETNKSHLWHAACAIAFLIAHEARDLGVDDRNK